MHFAFTAPVAQCFHLFLALVNEGTGAFSCMRSCPSECLLLQCNTSRSRPPVRLRSLTFQAVRGSIKGAEVPAEEGTEHYLSWCGIRDKFNRPIETLKRQQQLLQLFFRGHGPLPSPRYRFPTATRRHVLDYRDSFSVDKDLCTL